MSAITTHPQLLKPGALRRLTKHHADPLFWPVSIRSSLGAAAGPLSVAFCNEDV